MSEQALRRAVKLVNQFMNRSPGERRGPPVDEATLRQATRCAERGDLGAAIATLRHQESKTVYHRWNQTNGIFGEWLENTGNNVHAFSKSVVSQQRFTEDEACSIADFLHANARFILDEIEDEEEVRGEEDEEEPVFKEQEDERVEVEVRGAVKRVRRSAVAPTTGDDHSVWLSNQFMDEYGPPHDE